jgi:predicted RNA-binding protein (TIGR00451 family)
MQYLVNGADLMLPGVDTSSLPEFSKGDLVAISVHDNPLPLAVGTAGMSSSDARSKAAQGVKGKLVAVLQGYGDCLCKPL